MWTGAKITKLNLSGSILTSLSLFAFSVPSLFLTFPFRAFDFPFIVSATLPRSFFSRSANVIGCLTLADCCLARNIHLTNIATGCIYEYDAAHPIGFKGFTEEDEPNYNKSFYSETKAYLDKMIRHFPNVLNLRLRMPISDDLNPRSILTKISKYPRIVCLFFFPFLVLAFYSFFPVCV